MNNKLEIVKAFRKCIDGLRDASESATKASEALEQLPDRPTPGEVAEFHKLLNELTASVIHVGTLFGNNLQKFQLSISQN